MENRKYLRISISNVNIQYNVVPDGKPPPVLVSFSRGGPVCHVREGPKEIVELESGFQRRVMDLLRRLEDKVDRIADSIGREKAGKDYQFQGEVMDIGGGGLSFRGQVGHAVGTLLDIRILPEYGDPTPLFAVGEVRWVKEERDESYGPPYIVGVEFAVIHDEDQETIVRMVFQIERMRKRRRQRMGNASGRDSLE